MSRALVVGMGSIGLRHAQVLSELGVTVAAHSRRSLDSYECFTDLPTALGVFQPGYVVVANETSRHLETVELLASLGFEGRVLVEKPLFHQLAEWPQNARFEHAAVGFNLRFHPGLTQLKTKLQGQDIRHISIRTGQYLPDWRPDREFKTSYSANQAQGGGVLRDLSHELDYLLWVFGDWKRVVSLGGNLGVLEIDADEAYSFLLEMENGAHATVSINYLDRPAQRTISAITTSGALTLDMISGQLTDGNDTIQFQPHRNDTYRAMHQAILAGDMSVACTVPAALAVLELQDAIERSNDQQQWYQR